jgi:dihydroorotase/N-acyl-D-amino-acid deacylase
MKIARLVLPLFLACSFCAFADYDLVIRNARIIDGTGNPWYRGDIAVKGDTIARIAPSITEAATRTIDAGGLVVTPGFIDVHTHAVRGIFQMPTADNYVRQGVTTVFEGLDGATPLSHGAVKPFLDKLEKTPHTPNVGSFLGQGGVREAVIGLANRKATPEEIEKMKALVAQAMKDGAFGLSTGLFYVPGNYTPMEEVVELEKVVSPYRGVHMSHMRSEAGGVVESVKETIAIGELGGVPTHVSHHKMMGKPNWGKSSETLKLIDEARARGLDVTLDQYPYEASSTSIQAALVPQWALEGGIKEAGARVKDPAVRAKVRAEIVERIAGERGGGAASNVSIAECTWDPSLNGMNLADLTKKRGFEATKENAAETVLWILENGGCRGVFHAISEEDIERVMRYRLTMIASDGEVAIPGKGVIHPRSYGTFARVLGVYVREKHIISLEDAVRKMTSLPAQRTGLEDRGVLRPGMKADIVIFDPDKVRDVATYDNPHQYAVGYQTVIVNGEVAFENGAMTPARPGRVLYGPGKSS